MNRPNVRRLAGSPLLPPALVLLGAVLVLLAERIWPGTAIAPYLNALGAAALMAAAALRPVAGWLLAPYALLVLALALYHAAGLLAAGSPAAGSLGTGGVVDWADLARAGWALCALAGLILLGFVTLARLSQRRVPGGDPRRIRLAGAAGLSMALLTLLVVLLNVVFSHLPWQWNLAYFKTTRPSQATREVAQTLSEPLEVALFFAVDSEVRPLMEAYFGALQAALGQSAAPAGAAFPAGDKGGNQGGSGLSVRFLDAHLAPAEAEAFKVRDNGWLALRRGGDVQPLHVGERLDQARATLRRFDRTFFAKLVAMSRPKAVVYLTVGHGERAEQHSGGNRERALDQFRAVLVERNYTVKELGLTSGLAERVPEDAALVVSTAPTAPFLATEADALRAYLDGGGRMLAFLEPEAPKRRIGGLPGVSLTALLQDFGVGYDPHPLANERFHARRTNTQADRALLFTAQYHSHPATANLRRTPTQFPLLLLGAGSLRVQRPPDALEVKPIVGAMPGTWADRDGNFAFDAGREVRAQPTLALGIARRPKAVEAPTAARKEADKPGAKAPAGPSQPMLVVFGDMDLASDLLLPYRANRLAVEDALGWLVARDEPVGLPASEEDIPIQHARSSDWLWFYLPILGVPALVLAFGVLRVSRQRRRRGGGDA